jgi:hypothetical protein
LIGLAIGNTNHTRVFKFSGCLKTDPKLENNSFRAPETMNCTFWQKFRVDCKLIHSDIPDIYDAVRRSRFGRTISPGCKTISLKIQSVSSRLCHSLPRPLYESILVLPRPGLACLQLCSGAWADFLAPEPPWVAPSQLS